MKATVTVVAVLVAGSVLGGCVRRGEPLPPPPQPTVSATSSPCELSLHTLPAMPGQSGRLLAPAADSLVGQSFAIEAEISSLTSDLEPWTLVQILVPAAHPSYSRLGCAAQTRIWPGPYALTPANGKFSGPGYCAGQSSNDVGLQCRLMLVLADATASARLRAYNTEAMQSQDYPGLAIADLTGRIAQLASVLVTRSGYESPPGSCKPLSLGLPIEPKLAGSFVSPANNARIDQSFVMTSHIGTVPAGYRVWTLLTIVGPAGHPTFLRNGCVAATRIWPSPLEFDDGLFRGRGFCAGNTAKDADLQCRLSLLLADATSSAVFTAYQTNAAAQGFPGLGIHDLKGDNKLLAQILVTRRKPSPPRPSQTASPGCTTPALAVPSASIAGSFASPGQGSRVNQAFALSAQISTVPSGREVWTLLQVTGPPDHPTYLRHGCLAATRIWPGPGPLAASGLLLTGFAFCGGSADAALRCRLTLVLADSAAGAKFRDYNNEAASRGYPGLSAGELTGSLQKVAVVDVIRQ